MRLEKSREERVVVNVDSLPWTFSGLKIIPIAKLQRRAVSFPSCHNSDSSP
jgi:hypothetical protein